ADHTHCVADRWYDAALHLGGKIGVPPIIPPCLALDGVARSWCALAVINAGTCYGPVFRVIVDHMLAQRLVHEAHDRPDLAILISSASTSFRRSRLRFCSISLIK